MSGPADVRGIGPIRKVAAYIPMSSELLDELDAATCGMNHTDYVPGCSHCPARIAAALERERIRDHEGPCKLTVDAVLTITFPVTIDVDKQAGEDPWDLHDRYHAELRNVALHWRAGWVPDVELCDARIELL